MNKPNTLIIPIIIVLSIGALFILREAVSSEQKPEDLFIYIDDNKEIEVGQFFRYKKIKIRSELLENENIQEIILNLPDGVNCKVTKERIEERGFGYLWFGRIRRSNYPNEAGEGINFTVGKHGDERTILGFIPHLPNYEIRLGKDKEGKLCEIITWYDYESSGKYYAAKKVTCEKSGGNWLQTDDGGGVCAYRTSDAGKECIDSRECESYCEAPPGAKTGDKVTGRCNPWTKHTGGQDVSGGIAQNPWVH